MEADETDDRLSRRPMLFAGDLVRAIESLAPDAEAVHEMVKMLRLDRLRPGPETTLPGAFESRPIVQPASTQPWQATRDSGDDLPSDQATPAAPQSFQLTRLQMTKEGDGSIQIPSWNAGKSIAPPRSATPQEPQPLIAKNEQRATLSAMVSSYVNEGAIDVPRLIDNLIKKRPIASLPCKRVATLRRGVQLLNDQADSMQPFYADQKQLIRSLRDLLAEGQLDVQHFTACPTRGVRSKMHGRQPSWRPPMHPQTVLLLSDLGIGGCVGGAEPASVSEWIAFADQVRQAECSLVALVPYPANRWPRPLAGKMALVHWDRKTRAGTVMRAVRRMGADHR